MALALNEPIELKKYTGLQRAAALMLALGKEHGAPIWSQLSVEEMKEMSSGIAQLGKIPAPVLEFLLTKFTSELTSKTSLHGSYDSIENLLEGMIPEDRVSEIMQDIRGPSGRTMWDKLTNVNESLLAGYLKHEYPQTIAVILHKLSSDHAARVLAELPRDISVDVVMRMLRIDTVQKDILAQVEDTLKNEFMSNLSRSQRRDPYETMAEMFNALDRATEEEMLGALDETAPDAAARIRALMFTFEDLANLTSKSIQVLVKNADKREMALALKGASEEMKQLFFSAMTERAAKLLRDDMVAMGPVRARECEEAQGALVRLAKSLADKKQIMLVDPKSEESMIY
jgi:flagellar motor switch protein FliG